MIKTPVSYDENELIYYPQIHDADGDYLFEAMDTDTAKEIVKRINTHDELVSELKSMKQFLEDMHMMPVDWTIKESQHRHNVIEKLLERCK